MASVTIRGSRDPSTRKLVQEGQVRRALGDEGNTSVFVYLNRIYFTASLDGDRVVYSPNLTRPADAQAMTP